MCTVPPCTKSLKHQCSHYCLHRKFPKSSFSLYSILCRTHSPTERSQNIFQRNLLHIEMLTVAFLDNTAVTNCVVVLLDLSRTRCQLFWFCSSLHFSLKLNLQHFQFLSHLFEERLDFSYLTPYHYQFIIMTNTPVRAVKFIHSILLNNCDVWDTLMLLVAHRSSHKLCTSLTIFKLTQTCSLISK